MLWLASRSLAEPPKMWSRASSYTFAHDGPSMYLGFVSQKESDLVGIFTFENISGSRETAHRATLTGVAIEPDEFWPKVRYEAQKEAGGRWEVIGQSSLSGHSKRLAIEVGAPPVHLWVSLKLLQPLIGKYKFGRIVLDSGDVSEFNLNDLAP